MKIIDAESNPTMIWHRRIASGTWRGGMALAVALVLGGCGQPQLGPSPEAFKAVDALYTAVSVRDASQLDRCDTALKRFQSEGTLPDAASGSLSAIIAEARAGSWEPARQRLRDFMLAQRPQ